MFRPIPGLSVVVGWLEDGDCYHAYTTTMHIIQLNSKNSCQFARLFHTNFHLYGINLHRHGGNIQHITISTQSQSIISLYLILWWYVLHSWQISSIHSKYRRKYWTWLYNCCYAICATLKVTEYSSLIPFHCTMDFELTWLVQSSVFFWTKNSVQYLWIRRDL